MDLHAIERLVRACQSGELDPREAARQIRELAETLGIRLTIEDTWGGDLVTAAVNEALRAGRDLMASKVSSILPPDLGGLLPGL